GNFGGAIAITGDVEDGATDGRDPGNIRRDIDREASKLSAVVGGAVAAGIKGGHVLGLVKDAEATFQSLLQFGSGEEFRSAPTDTEHVGSFAIGVVGDNLIQLVREEAPEIVAGGIGRQAGLVDDYVGVGSDTGEHLDIQGRFGFLTGELGSII